MAVVLAGDRICALNERIVRIRISMTSGPPGYRLTGIRINTRIP